MSLVGSWREVCDALDAMSDAEVRSRIDDIETVISKHPDIARVPTKRWRERIQLEGVEPRLLACRELRIHTFDIALASADVARIKLLAMDGELDAAQVAAFVSHVARMDLRYLEVRGELGAAAKPLFTIGNLVSLVVTDCGLGDGALSEIAGGLTAITPTDLNLSWNRLRGRDVPGLGSLLGLAPVRRLVLSGNELHPAGIETLVSCPLGTLEELGLHSTCTEDEGAQAIASAGLHRLQALSLTTCSIGDTGARALATSTSLAGLHTLDLKNNRITTSGASAILNSACLSGLRRIDLSENEIDGEIVHVLATSPLLARLERLVIDDEHLSNDSRAAIEQLSLPVVEVYRA